MYIYNVSSIVFNTSCFVIFLLLFPAVILENYRSNNSRFFNIQILIDTKVSNLKCIKTKFPLRKPFDVNLNDTSTRPSINIWPI